MSRSVEEIVALYKERVEAQGPVLGKARELTATYNGDIAVPLPEMDKNEKVAVANLLQKGLDQMAMRIASTVPDVYFPPEKPGFKASEAAADIRRRATLGFWDANGLDILMGRRARQLLGYATAPVRVRWDDKNQMPRWTLGAPLSTFPAMTENPDDCLPSDCVFAYHRTLGWLRSNYPEAVAKLSIGDASDNAAFEVIEYVDDTDVVLAVLGKPTSTTPSRWGQAPTNPGAPQAELERAPNRIGMPLAVVPGRITLERRLGAFDGLIGLYQNQAKLMALEVIAVTEGVFPKTWLVARQGEVPEVVVEADPKAGITGMVRGGEISQTQLQPGYKTTETIDRLYQAQLVEGGIPPDLTGQSGTNIRTGKRGDSILSAVIDFPVQEAQRIFERSIEAENRIALALTRTYGRGKRSFYVNWKGSKGRVDYNPAKDFTDLTNFVAYPHAGADINQLVVGLGQRLATRLISRTSARRLDPLVDDPEFEERQTTAESMNDALLSAVGQDVQKGTYTAVELAQMVRELEQDPEITLAEVVERVQEAHQARQAAAPPPTAPEGQPGLAPGPGGPGGQANQPPGAIGPSPNEQGLAALLSSLHGPAAMAQAG